MALMEQLLLQATSTGAVLGAVVLLLVLYVLYSASSLKEEPNEPPGPKPLPLLGNLLQLDLSEIHESLCELAKIYGPIYKVYFGSKKVIVLAGYQAVKQALVNYAEEFGEREITEVFNTAENHGIMFSNGENWKEMRRFALTNLRDFGMGKRGSEEKIIEEIQYLKEVFENFGGEPFDTAQPMNYAVSNVISSIVYGDRFEYSDPQFKAMVNRANENVRIGGSASIRLLNIFPWIGPFLRTRRIILSNMKKNRERVHELVSQLQETLNPAERRGFIDSFLLRKQNDERSGQKNSRFNDKNLTTTVTNLFVAGTDTTSTTLRWALLFMAKYPHIQDQVQQEIDKVVEGRQPVVDDRKKLPYTDAVIHETQRLANIVPLNLPHVTSCDINFNGYFIKKGTTVFPLLTSVLKDETEWETPHSFNPAHFQDQQGRFVKKDAFMPFSAGRRVCLGEGLARMELFLFFTSLLQHFRFTPPPGVTEDQLDLTPVVGITLNPVPHKLCAVRRTIS
ncbi:cytochrome P450 2K1-like [Brachyhypopomus gauderio]|uniref:cytochrome P450 2K1-like n=1 Tax=Brachyhypopomus gauderio TaxID=698409 RepID=UPI0040415AB5